MAAVEPLSKAAFELFDKDRDIVDIREQNQG